MSSAVNMSDTVMTMKATLIMTGLSEPKKCQDLRACRTILPFFASISREENIDGDEKQRNPQKEAF